MTSQRWVGWRACSLSGTMWRTPDFLFLACLRQRCLCLAIRSGTLQRVLVPSCNSSTWSSSIKQQKTQAAAASSSYKTSPADMAHPCWHGPMSTLDANRLGTSCSLLRISTTIRPTAQSQLHGNDQGSTVTRRRSGEGQERGGVLCIDPASAAAAAAVAAASAAASKRIALLQAMLKHCLLLHAAAAAAAAATSARTISSKVLIFAATTPYSSRLNLA